MAEKTTTSASPNTTAKNSNNAAASAKNSNSTSLETIRADRHVWLMKCPALVSRYLQQQQTVSSALPPFFNDDNSNNNNNPHDSSSSSSSVNRSVAKVTVSVDPLLPTENFSSTQFTMELASTGTGNAPKCYSLDMSKDFVPMSVFSESTQGKLSLEGKIGHKFDMKPHSETLEDYGKLCRDRTNKSMKKTRQIQVIDDDSGQHLRPMPGLVTVKASGPPTEKKKMPAKGSEMKRTRRDRDEMEEIMFKLFERQPNWTLKQLIQETDQPEQFLKDMLKLLCVYNNKGSNQGTYELKPEYKTGSKDEPDSK